MVEANTKIFSERVGQLRLASIIVGLIALILTASQYFNIDDEKAFFWSVVVCFAVCIAFFLLHFLGLMGDENLKKVDKLYHILAAILLVVTAGFFLASVDKYGDGVIVRAAGLSYERRASGGAFGLLFGVLCGVISWFLFA